MTLDSFGTGYIVCADNHLVCRYDTYEDAQDHIDFQKEHGDKHACWQILHVNAEFLRNGQTTPTKTMRVKEINDCISFMAMCITDKEHSLEYKQESLYTKYSQGFMPKDVYEHMSVVLTSNLREE